MRELIGKVKQTVRNSVYMAVVGLGLMAATTVWGPAPLDRWAVNFWLWMDQGANAVLFLGDPQETVSSRMGKWYEQSGARGIVAWPVCKFLDIFDTGHCADSVNKHVGEKAVVK